jgi:protein-tyrosine phosphatase
MTETNARRPWLLASIWTAILGPYFFLVYGMCNWVSSQRENVPSFYWDWETAIPFVPLLILPYLSIDLFFAGSAFLCRSRRELHTLAGRVLFAISASGICFLLFPMRFAFQRPPVEGWLGLMFAPLNAHDLPYNLAPSLHISLRVILWSVYGRHLLGKTRMVAKAWFILIGLSTLLVWQHHVIDVIAGFAMGLLTLYVFADRDESARSSLSFAQYQKHSDVAVCYAIGAIVLYVGGALCLPAGALLFWPAGALALVAIAYSGAGPAVFQKTHGAISSAAEWILLPWLIVQSLIRRRWRSGPPWADMDKVLRFGRRPSRAEARILLADGVIAVIDLAAESTETRLLVEKTAYRQISVLDLTAPSPALLEEAVDFIREQSARGRVYVHCELGYSRSALVAAAWLLASREAHSVPEAIRRVTSARPVARLGSRHVAALEEFARRYCTSESPAMRLAA